MAALVYVDDTRLPGITRHRKGKGFAYRDADGRWLQWANPEDRAHLVRIRSLAIPPAYATVWICPLANGHLQATGRDARGRKQYRYHALWREARDEHKFRRMQAFGRALTAVRARLDADLSKRASTGGGPAREQVLATLVRLLDTTHVRIGNASYARENASFGLTTLHNEHAEVSGPVVRLHFRGKSGVWHDVMLNDPRVARVVRRCQALPGQDLFEYEDEDGARHVLGSADVNDYIRDIASGDFTAKDFRTWHATVHAWALLAPAHPEALQAEVEAATSRTARAKLINEALRTVAERLGNTLAVCRKSYVHPQLIECAMMAEWPDLPALTQAAEALRLEQPGLTEEECRLLVFLDQLAPRQEAAVSLRKISTRRLRARP